MTANSTETALASSAQGRVGRTSYVFSSRSGFERDKRRSHVRCVPRMPAPPRTRVGNEETQSVMRPLQG